MPKTSFQKSIVTYTLTFLILGLFVSGPFVVMAQVNSPANPSSNSSANYTPLSPLPCVPANGVTCPNGTSAPTTINFQNYVQSFINIVIALAAAAAVFMIVLGGFQYMTTDSWNKKSDGLERARNALLGLLLVLCSYIILRTIDPRLVTIPSGLVEKIKTATEQNDSLSAYLSVLDSTTTAFDPQQQAINNNIVNGFKDLSATNSQLNQINDQIRTAVGDNSLTSDQIDSICKDPTSYTTEVISACIIRGTLQSSALSTQSNITSNQIEQVLLDKIRSHNCTVGGDASCYDGINQEIATQTAQLLAKYGSSLQADQIQSIRGFAAYTQQSNTINQAAATVNNLYKEMLTPSATSIALSQAPGSTIVSGGTSTLTGASAQKIEQAKTTAINTINQAVTQYASYATADPTMLQNLKDQAQSLIAAINKLNK